jgi:FkbM family methyltransferase
VAVIKRVARRLMPHPLYRLYRQQRVSSQVAVYKDRRVTHVYGGHELQIHLADKLAEGWYDHDWDEPVEIAFLRAREILRPGVTVFDLGAHQGVVALMLARIVSPNGQVIAVEAEPHNAKVAATNNDLNGGTMTVIHAAVAASPGKAYFAEDLNGHVDETTGVGNADVIAVTIDTLVADHGVPDLVFIDIEGYEQNALVGAPETLLNGTTSFFIEVHPALTGYGGSASEVLDYFQTFDRHVAFEHGEFTPFNGTYPDGRWFLIAMPASR